MKQNAELAQTGEPIAAPRHPPHGDEVACTLRGRDARLRG
jgi:hypothetical protein